MTSTDFGRQLWPEHCQFLSFGRAHVRGEAAIHRWFLPLWSEEQQLGELGRSEPGETAAIVGPAESESPIAVEPVPAKVRDLEGFAAHGLHWISKQRLHDTHPDRHGHLGSLSHSS